MAHEDHIAKLGKYGIIASMQPNFVPNWQLKGGMYERRLGWERAKNMNRFRSIMDRTVLAFGSDNMPLGPLYGIYGAMIHPSEEERLSFSSAVYAYTYGSAFSIFREDYLGLLESEYEASFVVLNIHPQGITPKKVNKAKIEIFVKRGKNVLGRISSI